MKINKAFTLVELIVTITILAILSIIAFVNYISYTNEAKNSQIIYNITNLNTVMQMKLTKGIDINNIIIQNRTPYNGVNSGATVGSGAYKLGDLKYEVGIFNFSKIKLNGADFKYDNKGIKRDFLFGYVKSPKKLYYEFGAEIMQQSGKNIAIIRGNYIPESPSDTKGLISESGSDIGVKNGQILTGSLY